MTMNLRATFPKTPHFATTHWPARPLLHHGPLERLGRVASARELRSADALLRAVARSGKACWVEREHHRPRPEYVSPDAEDLYAKGAIYTCFEVERLVPAVATWLDTLKRELDLPATEPTCHAYLSAPGARVRVHFDRQENIALHLWGKKTWQIAKNETIAYPFENHALEEAPPPALAPLAPTWPKTVRSPRTIAMRPGTALFVPRGMWHSTVTHTASLSLTAIFPVPSWADLLTAKLRQRLLADERFRAPATKDPAALAARADDFLAGAKAVLVRGEGRYVAATDARLRGKQVETKDLSIALDASFVPLVRWMLATAGEAFALADAPPSTRLSAADAARIASFLEAHGVLRRER